ncbi:MAG: DUF3500 domain-containing protein [Phycisphaeraceae bacterium]|nr:DUF3500 domain-containing protein [Phycisphaeraceae bacterium]
MPWIRHTDRLKDPAAPARRCFLHATAATAAAAAVPAWMGRSLYAAPSFKSKAETAAAQLFVSLDAAQRKKVVLPFNAPQRTKISPNWHITRLQVGDCKKQQQALIQQIVRGVTSGEGHEKFLRQMSDDDGGIDNYAFALFGDPETGKFEFELTGRHLTLRADGNCVPGAAFGGPIVYGHSKRGNSAKNLFSYQTDRANELFAALDAPQRQKALRDRSPRETAVRIQGPEASLPGVAGAALSADQKQLLGAVFKDILAPYRKEDVDEAMKVLEAGGGIDRLHCAFYKDRDLGSDGKWDVWRLEGPTVVCHFRGAPHVHAYINISTKR